MQYLSYLDDIMDILHYVAGLTYPVTEEHHIRPNYVCCQVCHRNIRDHEKDCVVKKAQNMLEAIFVSNA
jgi:hypothetical protein